MTKIGIMNPLHMVYGISYPWYFKPPNHGKTKPVCMVFWPPYSWYIANPLSMVYWAPYAWYIEPSTHDISKPLSMVYRTPLMESLTLYPWHIEPPAHGILTSLPIELPRLVKMRMINMGSTYHMVYWTRCRFFRGSRYHMTPVYGGVSVAQSSFLV